MTLEQIFYLSQSIASVAVVGSLIYLGLQVRSAERSQRAIMQQGRADRASNAALAIASPELAHVFQRGVAGDPTLTREELTQWMMICRALFLSGAITLLLGILITVQWPSSALWVIGTFIGVDLIFYGFALLTLARAVKK